jgi:superfamily I DNA and RNA helicase
MPSSFFFLQADRNQANQSFIQAVEKNAAVNNEQTYIISRPLGDSRYSYPYESALLVLSPRRKLTFVDFAGEEAFDDFVEDFLEDVSSLSDKYRYKDAIGRPRNWRKELVLAIKADEPTPFELWVVYWLMDAQQSSVLPNYWFHC